MVEFLFIGVVLSLIASLFGLPAVAPLLFLREKHARRKSRFSLAALFDLVTAMALVLTLNTCLEGIERPVYSVAGVVVGSAWWLVMVRALSRVRGISAVERRVLLVGTIPFVFVAAAHVLGGIVFTAIFDRRWVGMREGFIVVMWFSLVLQMYLVSRRVRRRHLESSVEHL